MAVRELTPSAPPPQADNRSELRRAIEATICRVLGLDRREATAEARLYEDLGLDSFDLCELLDAVESELGVRIPERRFGAAESVEDLVRAALEAVDRHGGKPSSVSP